MEDFGTFELKDCSYKPSKITRDEEIEKASKEFAYNVSSIRPELNADSFKQGAKWADEHPKEANGKELLYVCQRTGEIIKKEMIMKACEGISQLYTLGVLDWKNCDSIIEEFKKAMEE